MATDYIVMYDPEEMKYCIVRRLMVGGGAIQSFEAIDSELYDDVELAAKECTQLNNLMGGTEGDA